MEAEEYVGDGMRLELGGGRRYLVVGNRCRVRLRDNSASVQVVGDGCEVRVDGGGGGVLYVGNGGAVRLGDGVAEEVVTYVGRNGRIASKGGGWRRVGAAPKVRLEGCRNVSVEKVVAVRLPQVLGKMAGGGSSL